MSPYDYTIQAANPATSFAQGAQLGFGLQQMQDARAQAEAQRAAQAQMNAELSAASQDMSKLPGVMVRYPQLAEKLKHGWDAMNANQQQEQLTHGGEVLSALAAGRPDVAEKSFRDRAEALRNSGDERGAQFNEAMAQVAKTSPDQLRKATAMRIAAVPGGDKVIEGVVKLGAEQRAAEKAPAELSEAQSKAQSAAVAAKFAESNAVKELALKDATITKLAADTEIARQNSRIAAMNAQISRESNDLKRQELGLKIDETIQKRDDLARSKVAEVRQGAATLDSLLNTVEQVKKHKALNSVVGPLAGKESYPHNVVGMSAAGMVGLVSDADERADAITLIEQLQSQATLGQLQALKSASATGASGFGALSEKELQVIQNGIQSLKRTQSPESFRTKLDEMSRLMKKNRDILSSKYGIDAGAPDTPAAPGARPPLSSFGGN